MRQLTHQLLSAQEEEWKSTSRELRDEIAQTLLAIDVRLVALKKEAILNVKDFEKDPAQYLKKIDEAAAARAKATPKS